MAPKSTRYLKNKNKIHRKHMTAKRTARHLHRSTFGSPAPRFCFSHTIRRPDVSADFGSDHELVMPSLEHEAVELYRDDLFLATRRELEADVIRLFKGDVCHILTHTHDCCDPLNCDAADVLSRCIDNAGCEHGVHSLCFACANIS